MYRRVPACPITVPGGTRCLPSHLRKKTPVSARRPTDKVLSLDTCIVKTVFYIAKAYTPKSNTRNRIPGCTAHSPGSPTAVAARSSYPADTPGQYRTCRSARVGRYAQPVPYPVSAPDVPSSYAMSVPDMLEQARRDIDRHCGT
eukprot:358376-Rhodomonas_salina.1